MVDGTKIPEGEEPSYDEEYHERGKLFTEYGQLHFLLDVKFSTYRDACLDMDKELLERNEQILVENIRDLDIINNEEIAANLSKKLALVMIRKDELESEE